MNSIKNFIMKWAYAGKNERPDWYKNHRRSNVWGVLRELINTQPQFEDTLSKVVKALANTIKNDPKSKEAVEKDLWNRGLEARKAAIARLSVDLKDPPPAKKEDSLFGTEDTSCTTGSPNDPLKDDGKDGEKKENETGGGDLPISADSPEPLKCHGVGGDVWMIHRDQAVSAAEQFCAQDIKEKVYFQGSVDEVKLSLSNTDSSKPVSGMTDCVEKFKTIVDSCDGDNPVNNPHNYKFGGTYTDPSGGWELKIEPLAVKVTENSCDITYNFIENRFEVRGKNFPDGKLGADGEGLKKEIKGCGALTMWEFKWTPDDVKYQWYASGALPLGTKSCVGAATQTAGGKEAGHCKGPG
ncbi:MAG: hypothetical protein Q9226_003862 [Calogaya cf. arnoldii]